MAYTPPAIPSLPPGVDPALRQFLVAIKESIEVRTRQRGNALDSSPTFRDLLDAGLITLKDGVTINGRAYSMDQLIGMVQFGLPNWVTSDLAPPSPAGLAVSLNTANTVLSWTPSTFDLYMQTEIWRSGTNNLTNATQVGSTSGSTFVDVLPTAGATFYYWIRDVSMNGQVGPFNATGGTSTNVAPSATTLTATLSSTDGTVTLSWPTPVSNLAVQYYVIQYGGTAWGVGTTQLTVVNANSYRTNAWWIGGMTFRIKAVDINGNYGPEATVVSTVVAPSAPVSFTNSIIGNKAQLDWSAVTSGSLPTRRYEVRYGASYAAGTFVAQVDGTTLRTAVNWTGARTFWVAAIDYAGNVGTPGSVAVTITAPAVTSPTASFSGEVANISWATPSSSLPIDYYSVTQGASRTSVAKIYGNQAADTVLWGGAASRTYYVIAYDINGNAGPEGSVTLTSTPLSAPVVSLTIPSNNPSFNLTWTASTGSLPVLYYEIFDGATSLGKTASQVFSAKVYWSGSKTLTVVPTDVGGVVGSSGTANIVVNAPAAPVVTTQTVDNNVLLYWTNPSSTLPITTFEIRRGATWAGATLIGTKSGGFTSIFETVAGTYNYWVAGIDSAGNYGTPQSVTATVAQPPDYVLKANYISTFTGTKSNAVMYDASTLIMPVNATETFATHFTGHAWTSPQDQINAGLPVYIQPALSPGYYEEVIDYGATLAASRVTVTWLLTTVAGTVTVNCDISVSLDGSTYTTYAGMSQVYATNFRYIKYRLTMTASTTAGIGMISNISTKLDSKLKTINGMVSCLASDSGGTTVYLTDDRTSTGNKVFLDVDAIQLTGLYNATYPGLTSIYDFVDAPNPLSFKVLMYDTAGNRISGTSSYTVRGF